MNRFTTSSFKIGLAVTLVVIAAQAPLGSFQSKIRVPISAKVILGDGSVGNPSGVLTLNVPKLLPALAFSGKDIVIPIEVQGPASTSNLGAVVTVNSASTIGAFLAGNPVASNTTTISQGSGSASSLSISLIYQLWDDNDSNPLSGQINVPISFQRVPSATNRLQGIIIVPVQNTQAVRRQGIVHYFFQVVRGNQQIQFKRADAAGPADFRVRVINTFQYAVSDQGSAVVIPDTNLLDGKTQLIFAPQALSNSGTLVVTQLDVNSVPSGPGGLLPVMSYNFELHGTQLVREAQLTLSYPAHMDGTLIGSNANPQDLAPYKEQGSDWLVLGPRQWDSTLHNVTVATTHLSTFGLFSSGAIGTADSRPKERIITPNGDGINDTVDFSRISPSAGIHIYDLKGRRVRVLTSPPLIWDGKDDGGSIVESGLYIYQYTVQGTRISGVVLVAK